MKIYALAIILIVMAAIIVIGDSVGVRFPLFAELKTNKNQPNGYAGLDANGDLDAALVEPIYIHFAGGEAVDVQ